MSATVSSTFSRRFRRVAAGLAASLALGALSAHAALTPFPADFRSLQVVNADATINVRVGGHGPAVVLIHGFGDTGDMPSFVAIIVGGVGSLTGTLIGGLLIGVASGITAVFLPAASEAIMYVLMAVVLLIRPRGLLGEEGMMT